MARKKADREQPRPSLELARLDLGQLAFFAGQRVNEVVLERLHATGYDGIRLSHGYVVQHLIGADRSVTELSRLMGVTQQAASKVTSELTALGYLERVESEDARVRRVRLSRRGRAMLECTRKLRREIESELGCDLSRAALAQARNVLAVMLRNLGGAEAVERRRLRESR